MIVSGLLVTALAGICLALCISRQLKSIEVLGLAFPLGFGLQTFLMVCLDWLGIKLTSESESSGIRIGADNSTVLGRSQTFVHNSRRVELIEKHNYLWNHICCMPSGIFIESNKHLQARRPGDNINSSGACNNILHVIDISTPSCLGFAGSNHATLL
jgi:hypothetical protein